jgi:hypothetical protein
VLHLLLVLNRFPGPSTTLQILAQKPYLLPEMVKSLLCPSGKKVLFARAGRDAGILCFCFGVRGRARGQFNLTVPLSSQCFLPSPSKASTSQGGLKAWPGLGWAWLGLAGLGHSCIPTLPNPTCRGRPSQVTPSSTFDPFQSSLNRICLAFGLPCKNGVYAPNKPIIILKIVVLIPSHVHR